MKNLFIPNEAPTTALSSVADAMLEDEILPKLLGKNFSKGF